MPPGRPTTGTIDLNGDTLSINGLAAEESKGLTPEAAAPVVHAVADCSAAGLTTLQLNSNVSKGLSTDNEYWLTFTCQDGARGKDEAAILQKATEL